MSRRRSLGRSALRLAAVVCCCAVFVPTARAAEYVGRQVCSECHSQINEVFVRSGHPYKLNKVVDGQPPVYPFTEVLEVPVGYTWADISYVIGGYNWKARFIDQEGYIITGPASAEPFGAQYNFPNPIVGTDPHWVPYHQGEKKAYDCGICHTTGYANDPDTHQDGLPGLIGTWSEPGVQCEACHGPGGDHAADPTGVKPLVDRDSDLCGKCHYRGVPEELDAKGGFIRHHEQYEELFQSKHLTLKCIDCHDPHAGVIQLRKAGVQTTRTSCENCHFKEAQYQASGMMKILVDCVDCHMPRITKSAVANAAKFTGDMRTHLMAVDPTQLGQFTEDGKFALSQAGLDFACKSCHVAGGSAIILTDEQLRQRAYNYHARPDKL